MTSIVHHRDDFEESDVGGKIFKQRVMLEAGLPVPEFFSLTVDFYDAVFQEVRSEIEAVLDQIDFARSVSLRAAAASIAEIFENVRLSEAQRDAITRAFDAAFDEDALVSVRASTVGFDLEQSEDSQSNAFAGMSETFLYVRRDTVIEKIKRCWASGFSEEAMLYRHAQGMDLLGFRVAVAVQRMVFGTRSFVLFTMNPNTAARDTIIVAGHGIGEGVVQERVETDHYFVNAKTGKTTSEIAKKERMLGLDREAGEGLAELPVPEPLRETPCLSDADIRELVARGREIETLFGCPQDIEGTYTEDGRLFFLQSRPVTIDFSRQRVWTNTNVTESYPGVSSPLTYSFATHFYRVIFYDLYRMLGVSPRVLQDNRVPLENMLGYLGGRVYYNLSHFYLLHKQSPLFPLFGAHWENMIGLPTSYETEGQSKLEKGLAALGVWSKVPPALAATTYQYATHERRMSDFHRWWEDRVADLRGRDFADDEPMALRNLFFEIWNEVGNRWGVTLTTDAYLIPLYGLCESLFERWGLSQSEPGLLSDLLCGDESLMSVEILLSAVGLAERVRKDPELDHAFRSNDAHRLWEMAEAGELSPEFTNALHDHLHRFGDRGLQELKLEQPALRDTPWVLLKMIAAYAKGGVTVESVRDHERGVREAADAKLATLLEGRADRRATLSLLLPRLRRLIRHRENSRYCRAELFGVSRKLLLGIAAHLVREGVLASVDDAYYLRQDEILGFVDGSGVTRNLQGLADVRRAEHAENLELELPEHITTLGAVRLPVVTDANRAPSADGLLEGLGSSAGRVRGRAKVVLDPNTVDSVDEDMILVARETDPGWLFLMLASKGMVVERGSMLSHTAITGRKFGIPTIVALPEATSRIPDGALIEIDGSSGRVTVLSEESTDATIAPDVDSAQSSEAAE